jgi:pyruvate formate lyase activating enzyme
MNFSGIYKTSLIDYPDNVSTVLFTPGCNLRCPYCYNWRIIKNPPEKSISATEVLNILDQRRKFIDFVTITGGEPTIQKELPSFLEKLKKRGFKIKLDTNGVLNESFKKCLPYLDYVALDVKTSTRHYPKLGIISIEGILNTIKILKKGIVNYEFRCTVVPGFVDEEIVSSIGKMVEGAKLFVFQQFISGDTLDPSFKFINPYSEDRLERIAKIMESYVEKVKIRF